MAHQPLRKFSYDNDARITRAEDTEGHWAIYTYKGGMLTDVAQSSGASRHYSYQGSLLTSIADEHGKILLQNTFENGQVVEQKYAGGQVYRYVYLLDASRHYVEKVLITLLDQSSREITIDGVPEAVRAGLPA